MVRKHVLRDRPKVIKPTTQQHIVIEQPEKKEKVVEQQKPVAIKPSPHHTELDITAVIINFKTPNLIRVAFRSLHRAYPKLKIILVDNGSQDDSMEYIKKQAGHAQIVLNEKNIGHGPAIHQAIALVKTRYVFLMDSDCSVLGGGFLEQMQQRCEKENLYAIGWKRWVDRVSGVPKEWHIEKPPSKQFVAYIHPAASLYRVAIYRELKPAYHHGAPLLQNMVSANQAGHKVASFPIFEYVEHLVAGTRRMYGGQWSVGNKQPKAWNKKESYPI